MSFPCDACHDYGVVFLGDNNDYSVEPCDCMEDDLLLDWNK
jgi:hypothetical protein